MTLKGMDTAFMSYREGEERENMTHLWLLERRKSTKAYSGLLTVDVWFFCVFVCFLLEKMGLCVC